jgi:hypothetical protein
MGWTTSPYPRACALSCPSPALYGGRPFPDSPWPLYCYHPHGPDAPSLRRVASPSLFVPSPRKFLKLVHLGDAPPCFEHKLQVLHMQGRGHSSSRPTHQARSNEMVRSAVCKIMWLGGATSTVVGLVILSPWLSERPTAPLQHTNVDNKLFHLDRNNNVSPRRSPSWRPPWLIRCSS